MNKHRLWLILLFAAFLLLTVPRLGERVVDDETTPYVGAREFLRTGGSTTDLGHPTLYYASVALSFAFLGVHEHSARLVSLLFVLGTGLLVYALARRLSPDPRVPLLGLGLYLFSPIVVQGSLLVDIDNSILAFLMTLFVLLLFRWPVDRPGIWLRLGALFAVLLWAKLPTPPVLLAALFLCSFFTGKPGRGFTAAFIGSVKAPFAIGAVGGGLFLATWLLYATAFGLSPSRPFEWIFEHASGQEILGPGAALLRLLWGWRNAILWLTPLFFALVAIVGLARYREWRAKREARESDLLLLAGILVLLEYGLASATLSMGFPKYFVPMVPLLSVVVAETAVRKGWLNLERKHWTRLLWALPGIVVPLLLVGDPLLSNRAIFNETSAGVIARANLVALLSYLPSAVLLLAAGFGPKPPEASSRAARWTPRVAASCLLALVLWNGSMAAVQGSADYSTLYYYGQRGMEESIDYLQRQNPPDRLVAIYGKGPEIYLPNSQRFPTTPEKLQQLIQDRQVHYVLVGPLGTLSYQQYADSLAWLRSRGVEEARFGDYRVYNVSAALR